MFSEQQEETLLMTSLFDEGDHDEEMTWMDDSQAAHMSRFTASKHDTWLPPSDSFSRLFVLHTPSM